MATFGYTSIGASEYSMATGFVYATKFACPENGAVTAISLYCAGNTDGAKYKTAIYTDNAGSPNTLLATSDEVACTNVYGWKTFSISTAVSATDYWLAFESEATAWYKGDLGATSNYDVNIYPALPDPFTSDGSENRKTSIYATYTTSSGMQLFTLLNEMNY